MTIMLTGSNGYVGNLIAAALSKKGWNVCIPKTHNGKKWRLLDPIPKEEFNGVDTLVHVAWDMDSSKKKKAFHTNVLGSQRLIDQAIAGHVKHLIFISTMSAYEGCHSYYGKTKLLVEQEVLQHGGIVIRPGLINSKNSGGMIGKLSALVNKLPMIPLPCANKNQYFVDDTTVTEFIDRAIIGEIPSGIYSLANPVSATMKEIVLSIAKTAKKRVFIVPVPWQFLWLGLFIAQLVRLKLSVNTDNLIGLVKANPAPDFSSFIKYARK